ncbi:MAG TPA: DUF1302 domain-containing protein [Pseudomonas sp.]|nr:hypothetical protein [Pseudomonas sp.]MBB50337.1 hypothetical protein [Pseudomonadales bacterium]HCA23556.1 DUF1302 domain-containing protein [Pseudomonas sp.]|tara:strand:+ start:3212 stop:5053 length:1842 start_codon:yes stop_codon:yes gene_type:complete
MSLLNTLCHAKGRPKTLALSVALASLATASGANAANFQLGEQLDLDVSSTLTIGASWAMSDPDRHLLTKADAATIGLRGDGINYNADNGRMNFKKGDSISRIITGITDFDLSGDTAGAMLRLKYWYDQRLEHSSFDYQRPDDSDWDRPSRFKGVYALDAYVWKDFELFDRITTARLGRHVLSWGESLFLQNGVNAINPVDASAFNRPGVELKEGLLPVEMFSINTELTDNLGMEAFVQFKQRETVLDGCGTFFSVSDNFQNGCGFDYMLAGAQGTTPDAIVQERYLPRGKTQYARDGGQYGLAFNLTVPELNFSEFGFYFLNYHSRTPQIAGVIAREAPGAPGNPGLNLNTGEYSTVYPEDIRLYGLSFSTVIDRFATFAELSYRPNMPIGYNGADFVALLTGSNTTPILPVGDITGYRGQSVQGYDRRKFWQLTLGTTAAYSNVLNANLMTMAVEAGVNHIEGIDRDTDRFGRAGSFGRTPPTNGASCVPVVAAGTGAGGLTPDELAAYNQRNCNTDGLFTSTSWGLRSRFALSYESLLPATVISPAISFRYDVSGNGPNFQQNQKAVGLSLTGVYQNNYSVSLNYNNFFGSNKFSTINDRDFASINFKVDF